MDPFSQQFASGMRSGGGVQAQLQMGHDRMAAEQFQQQMAMQQEQMAREAAMQQAAAIAQRQAQEFEAQKFAAQQQMAQQEMAQKQSYYNYLGQNQQAELAKQQQAMDLAKQGGGALLDYYANSGDPNMQRLAKFYQANNLDPAGFGDVVGTLPKAQTGFNLGDMAEQAAFSQAMGGQLTPQQQAALTAKQTLSGGGGNKPMSDIGKVQSDYINGLITKDQYEAIVGKKTEESSELQKRENLAGESQMNIDTALNQLYKPDGSINRDKIPLFRQIALGESRTFTQAMERAIQNAVYLKTGQAAPPSEMSALMSQYMPNWLDNDEQIANKIASFKQFLASNAGNKPAGGAATAGGIKFLGFE